MLTGETGTGKSILLDSLGLALGARAEQGLVRRGAGQASVTACFAPGTNAALAALLDEHGVTAEDELVLRRVVGTDGKSRAYLNDQPVGVALLRRVAAAAGRSAGPARADGPHRCRPPMPDLLDSYAVPAKLRVGTARTLADLAGSPPRLAAGARGGSAAAARDEDWLRHAVDELAQLAPREDEEEPPWPRSAARCSRPSGGGRPSPLRSPSLRRATAARARPPPLCAPPPARSTVWRLPGGDGGRCGDTSARGARPRRGRRLAEAETLLTRLAAEADADPRRLEQAEERLFALRAAARKHGVAVTDLAALLDRLSTRLALVESGTAAIAAAEQAATASPAPIT